MEEKRKRKSRERNKSILIWLPGGKSEIETFKEKVGINMYKSYYDRNMKGSVTQRMKYGI